MKCVSPRQLPLCGSGEVFFLYSIVSYCWGDLGGVGEHLPRGFRMGSQAQETSREVQPERNLLVVLLGQWHKKHKMSSMCLNKEEISNENGVRERKSW